MTAVTCNSGLPKGETRERFGQARKRPYRLYARASTNDQQTPAMVALETLEEGDYIPRIKWLFRAPEDVMDLEIFRAERNQFR